MSAFEFKKATKEAARLKMVLGGFAGSGKTYTALTLARELADGKRVAVIDTEHGSASKYADLFDFDSLSLDSFSPDVYVGALRAAISAGYGVVVIDSLSHAWQGKDGALEQAGGRFDNWKNVAPKVQRLLDTIVSAPVHIVATLRTKAEFVVDKDSKGRTTIEKVGTKAVFKEGAEYEFDVVGDLDQENTLRISKTRIPALRGRSFPQPGKDLADIVKGWLTGDAPGSGSEELAAEVGGAYELRLERSRSDADALRALFAEVKGDATLNALQKQELLARVREAGKAAQSA